MILVSRDAVCAGPAPASFDDAWLDTRSRFLAETYSANLDDCHADLVSFEESFATAGDYDEAVLWYGHDLFCLIVMLSHAARLAEREPGPTTFSLVCPNGSRHQPPFHCLGDLRPEAMVALAAGRRTLDREWLRAAHEVWAAYTSADATALNLQPTQPLFRRALALHRARFPDSRTGLGAVEQRALARLTESDADFASLFADHCSALPDYGWGDLQFRADLMALVERPRALVRLSDSDAGSYSITAAGRAALAGELDLGSEDRQPCFLGGVELGAGHPWRYHADSGAIIRVA